MKKPSLPTPSVLGNFLKFLFFSQALPIFENLEKWIIRLLLNGRDAYCDFNLLDASVVLI